MPISPELANTEDREVHHSNAGTLLYNIMCKKWHPMGHPKSMTSGHRKVRQGFLTTLIFFAAKILSLVPAFERCTSWPSVLANSGDIGIQRLNGTIFSLKVANLGAFSLVFLQRVDRLGSLFFCLICFQKDCVRNDFGPFPASYFGAIARKREKS